MFNQAYTTNFSQSQFPKIQAKIHSTTSHSTNIAKIHDTPTLFKLHHDQKIQQFKMLQSQDYNMINHTMPQISIGAHNKMTMSRHQTLNGTWKQHFFQTKKQRKTHLEVNFRMWSIGFGVLKEPLFFIPFKWWMIFLPMKSKKRRPIGRGWHFCAKKREDWKWVSQKWVCSKNGQKHKDLKKYWRGWVKGSWKV